MIVPYVPQTPEEANKFFVKVNSRIPANPLFRLYLGSVTLCGVYGAWRGFFKWLDWLSVREKVKLSYPLYEPSVNISKDVGMFAWYTGTSAIASSFVVATAPISVPFLIYTTEKRPVIKEDL